MQPLIRGSGFGAKLINCNARGMRCPWRAIAFGDGRPQKNREIFTILESHNMLSARRLHKGQLFAVDNGPTGVLRLAGFQHFRQFIARRRWTCRAEAHAAKADHNRCQSGTCESPTHLSAIAPKTFGAKVDNICRNQPVTFAGLLRVLLS